jgi:tripartite-type tricarboxylate transporter receptor subunit TctC
LVQRIEQALSRAIQQPQLVAKIEAAGTELHAGTAQEVLAWTQRDTDKWIRVIKEAQIAID